MIRTWRYLCTGLILLLGLTAWAQQKPVDSLRNALLRAREDAVRLRILPFLVNSYEEINNDSALFYGKWYVRLAQESCQPEREANALKNLGYVYMNQGNYARSLALLFKALTIAQKYANTSEEADIFRSIGYMYVLYGDYEKARQYLLVAKAGKLKKNEWPQFVYAHLANAYEGLNRLDSARWYARAGYHMAVVSKTQLHLGYMMASLASVYARVGKTDSSIKLYQNSLSVCLRQRNYRTFSHNCVKLARLYYNDGQMDSCRYYALIALRFAGRVHMTLDIWEASSLLTKYYKARHRPDSAFYFQEIWLAAQDTLYNRQRVQQTQLVLFDEQQRVQKAEIVRIAYINRVRQYTLLAGLTVSGLLGLMLYRAYRRKQLTNALLTQQQQELRDAMAELKASQKREALQARVVDEMKMRFFANITHEFRTPLSLILAPVDKLLADAEYPDRFHGTLQTVRQNAHKLLRLINQLLDIARLEEGRLTVVESIGNPVERVAQLMILFRPIAEQKQIDLIFQPAPLTTLWRFDAEKWDSILTNLLANALKFTPAGGTIRLIIRLLPVREGFNAEIRLTDSGIGIPPEQIPLIFDRFYQIDNSPTRSQDGTGIGLSLVRELIILLGGNIDVSSRPGETTFLISLPIRPAEADGIVTAPAVNPDLMAAFPLGAEPAIKADLSDEDIPLVLVVEDNPELRSFLVTELRTCYRVLMAADGEEGWRLARTELPDVIISDIMMPLLDGFALTQRIKSNDTTDHIAVILLTAKVDGISKLDGLRSGAIDYIAKPFSLEEVKLRVSNQLLLQQTMREHFRQQLSVSDEPGPVQDIFLQRVYNLLDQHLNDPRLNVEWLADQLAVNRKTLYRKTQRLTQLVPNELIRRYRLRKATGFLKEGYSVAETAYQVGFETPNYFSQCFKEVYHQTPSEYIGQASVRNKRILPQN